MPQAGAICRLGPDIVLVTNSSQSRWVIPKGHVEPEDPNEAFRAQQESWEEAGVRGICQPDPLGDFFYFKRGRNYRVAVFLMESCQLSDDWPESGKRSRILIPPQKAAEMVYEAGLRAILMSLSKKSPS